MSTKTVDSKNHRTREREGGIYNARVVAVVTVVVAVVETYVPLVPVNVFVSLQIKYSDGRNAYHHRAVHTR
jgi:hypothetical protein